MYVNMCTYIQEGKKNISLSIYIFFLGLLHIDHGRFRNQSLDIFLSSSFFRLDRYTLGEFSAMQKIADALHNIDNLTVQERFTICNAPASER